MLERASTCLESGGRQLLRSPKQCLRSRRMLHSAFWNHGASDLNLPMWWAASSIFSGGSGDAVDRPARESTSVASTSYHGGMLDFLYPEKTLALLRKLSLAVPDTTHVRRHPHGTRIRAYSTAPAPAPQNTGSVDAEQAARDEVEGLLKERSAAEQLQAILYKLPRGKQEVAWQLYNAIPEADRATEHWRIQLELLEYLHPRLHPRFHSRVLALFEQIPLKHRRASSYKTAITACLSLRMVGQAIQLMEEALTKTRLDPARIGIDMILERTVQDNQWALTLRVFESFLRQKPKVNKRDIDVEIQLGNSLPEITMRIKGIPGLYKHLESFLEYVREFQHEIKTSESTNRSLSLFSMIFVPYVIEGIFANGKLERINKSVKYVLNEMDELDLPTSTTYELAILESLKLRVYQADADKRRSPIWLDNLWPRYRDLCLKGKASKPGSRPSKRIFRNLILHHAERNSMGRVHALVEDVREFYQDRALGPGFLKDLIHIYAEHGHTLSVKHFLKVLREFHLDQVDIFIIQAALFAYARRGDVDGAVAEFICMADEYKLEPDLACWNALLLAHVRADDLDGALDCFNNCLDSGMTPDKYTYNTLLNICAERGDIEAFEALFSKARESGVPLTHDVRARSGYVLAFLNAGDTQGAYEIAQGMLRNWKAGTLKGHPLTHTWNLLIQNHALEKDLTLARARYKEMIEHKIPLDTWTFGGLMRALVEVKQSNAAYKILRVTMPSLGLRVEAFHYAIVITGLLKEGGGQIKLAMDAYQRMKQRNVPQTEASREASLRLVGEKELRELRRVESWGNHYPGRRLAETEALLEKTIAEAMQEPFARWQPRHSRYFETRMNGQGPQLYYGLLISLYTERGAFKLIEKLIKRSQEHTPENANYTPPMTLIDAIMSYHLLKGQHAQVAVYWELAREAADKHTKTVRQAVSDASGEKPVKPSADLAEDSSSVVDQYRTAPIAQNRKHILFKASRLYIRSLLSRSNKDPAALTKAQATMADLLTHGYTVDNLSWNEVVTELAQRGRLVDAFKLAESYLIPGFPGWRELNPAYIRKDRPGYTWMELRHYDVKKSSILPRYKTLVVLAAALREVRRLEREGLGFVKEEDMWMRELLLKVGPLTYRAIETMPWTSDRLQERFIHSQQ